MYTEEMGYILDEIEKLSDMVTDSEIYYQFKEAQLKLDRDDEAHLKI